MCRNNNCLCLWYTVKMHSVTLLSFWTYMHSISYALCSFFLSSSLVQNWYFCAAYHEYIGRSVPQGHDLVGVAAHGDSKSTSQTKVRELQFALLHHIHTHTNWMCFWNSVQAASAPSYYKDTLWYYCSSIQPDSALLKWFFTLTEERDGWCRDSKLDYFIQIFPNYLYVSGAIDVNFQSPMMDWITHIEITDTGIIYMSLP